MTSPRLTATEQALLLYLHENRDRPVSREELVREVWQESFRTTSRTVDVTVGRIRRKLLTGIHEGAEVRTVRGAGYRYVGAELRPQLRPPPPVLPFVGRSELLEALHTWVQTRRGVLTLVGTVGIGKTALVRQFARDRASVQYIDVEQDGVPDELEPGRAVVLDNAHQHHASLCAKIVSDSTKQQRVIVTSRRPLGLSRERVVFVPPLSESDARELVETVLHQRTNSPPFIPKDLRSLFGMPWLLIASACSGEWSSNATLTDALPRHRNASAVATETLGDLGPDERSLLAKLLAALGWVDAARVHELVATSSAEQVSLDRLVSHGVIHTDKQELCALPYLARALPIVRDEQSQWRDHLVRCLSDPRFGHQWALHTRTGPTFARHLQQEQVPQNIVVLTQGLVRIANFSKAPAPPTDLLAKALSQVECTADIHALNVDLGLLRQRDGDHTQAMSMLRESVAWFRIHNRPKRLVWAVTWAGLLERSQGNTDAAMRDIQEAYRVAMEEGLSSPAASALLTIGAMHIDVGDYEASLGCSRGARALVPDDTNIRTLATGNLGTALVLLGRGREALREYKSLIPAQGLPDLPTDPVQCLLLGNIAEAQVMAGKPEHGSASAKRAVLGLQQTTSTLTGAVQMVWAQAELLCGRPESALAILHRAQERKDRWADRARRWTQIALAEMNSPTPDAAPLSGMSGWASVRRYDELVYAKLLAQRPR